MALVDEGDEAIYPNPGFPDLRVDDQLHGRQGRADPAARGATTSGFDVNELEQPDHAAYPADHRQLAAEPHRRRADADPTWRLSPSWPSSTTSRCWPTKSTSGSSTRASTSASSPSRACRSARSCSTATPRSYAMTGWRLGYGVMPVDLAKHVTPCRPMPSPAPPASSSGRHGGPDRPAGLRDDMVNEFQRARPDRQRAELHQGHQLSPPKGAFYVFPNITETGKDSRFMADYLLNEAGVAVLSGTAFGAYGEGFLRLSYANSLPTWRRRSIVLPAQSPSCRGKTLRRAEFRSFQKIATQPAFVFSPELRQQAHERHPQQPLHDQRRCEQNGGVDSTPQRRQHGQEQIGSDDDRRRSAAARTTPRAAPQRSATPAAVKCNGILCGNAGYHHAR